MTNRLYEEYTNDYARNEDEIIEDREFELTSAMEDVLEVFCNGITEIDGNPDEMVEYFKDLVSEQLYRKFGISIYRPMYLENENCELEFEDFPYEEMIFD